ncbi:MAG: patatin-like phospholipase family protein [Anaerolineae bacterium]|jgi:NTE family protein
MNDKAKEVTRALVLSGGGGRGAYQAGVCRVLEEKGWRPDMVVGNSIGATNGAILLAPAAGGSGAQRLEQLWREKMHNEAMHQVAENWPGALGKAIELVMKYLWHVQQAPEEAPRAELLQALIEVLEEELAAVEGGALPAEGLAQKVLGRPALLDRDGWHDLLAQEVDWSHLNDGAPYFGIMAADVTTGAPRLFWNRQPTGASGHGTWLEVEHLMASSSIPAIYGATRINRRYCWDGFLCANTPIAPALDAGATDIIAVLMTPWFPEAKGEGVAFTGEKPAIGDGLDRLLDWIMLSSFRSELKRRKADQVVRIVAPRKLLGTLQYVDYGLQDSARLIEHGVRDARRVLSD